MTHITRIYKEEPAEFNVDEIPRCPKCGSKVYISKDIVDGFYFGWSVGCPRFCHDDGIHGTNINTPEEDVYSIHGLNSRDECIKKWAERVKHLKEISNPNECPF